MDVLLFAAVVFLVAVADIPVPVMAKGRETVADVKGSVPSGSGSMEKMKQEIEASLALLKSLIGHKINHTRLILRIERFGLTVYGYWYFN